MNWKLRKAVAADLRDLYTEATVEVVLQQLAEFEEKRGDVYPSEVDPADQGL